MACLRAWTFTTRRERTDVGSDAWPRSRRTLPIVSGNFKGRCTLKGLVQCSFSETALLALKRLNGPRLLNQIIQVLHICRSFKIPFSSYVRCVVKICSTVLSLLALSR